MASKSELALLDCAAWLIRRRAASRMTYGGMPQPKAVAVAALMERIVSGRSVVSGTTWRNAIAQAQRVLDDDRPELATLSSPASEQERDRAEPERGRDGPGLHTPRRRPIDCPPGLARVSAWIVAVEAVLLVALGVAGLSSTAWAGLTAQPASQVVGFRMNLVHGLLLLGTGLLGFAALRHAVWLRRFTAAQTVWYMLLFVFGMALSVNRPSATMWNLNMADHILHAVLFIIGLVLVLLLYAGSIDPAARRG